MNGYPRGLGEQVFFERTQHVLAEIDIGTVSMIAPATAIVHKTKADRAKMVAGLISMTRQQRPRPCAISLRQGPTIRAGGFTSDPLLQRDAATREAAAFIVGAAKDSRNANADRIREVRSSCRPERTLADHRTDGHLCLRRYTGRTQSIRQRKRAWPPSRNCADGL